MGGDDDKKHKAATITRPPLSLMLTLARGVPLQPADPA